MSMTVRLEPGLRTFIPRSGTWLEKDAKEHFGRIVYVSESPTSETIIGSIYLVRSGLYRVRLYDKPFKLNTRAKNEPKVSTERQTRSLSSGVWDIMRRHKEELKREEEVT